MKFTFIVNKNFNEGFKVSFQAEGEKEQSVAKEMVKIIMDKVSKIEYSINESEDEEY